MNIFILAMVLLFAGCTKKPHVTVSGAVPEYLTESKTDNPLDPNEILFDLDNPSFTVLFDFDSYDLKESNTIQKAADFGLASKYKIHVIGHASEEGTDEYNMALGYQRAIAVQDCLIAFGLTANAIYLGSKGEMEPVTLKTDDIHLNRRVEITFERVEK